EALADREGDRGLPRLRRPGEDQHLVHAGRPTLIRLLATRARLTAAVKSTRPAIALVPLASAWPREPVTSGTGPPEAGTVSTEPPVPPPGIVPGSGAEAR